MGQKIKHKKLNRRSSASFNGDVFWGLTNKEVCPQPYSSTYAAKLNQVELSQHLHRIITSNLPYYTALATYKSKRFPIPRKGQNHKNHRLLSRLTESGLAILKTQFAKKPKNPV